MAKLKLVALILSILTCAYGQQCNNAEYDRLDCGFVGIDQSGCESRGCCWIAVTPNPDNVPYCFYQKGDAPCDIANVNWGAADPGFRQSDIDSMTTVFLSQINVQNSGAVEASPDTNTPGGSYFYHWMRDGALTYLSLMEINNDNLSAFQTQLDAYVDWVKKVQNETSIYGDIRVEPKFYIPTGKPYDQNWCRPQTDGPGLRAMALSHYGMVLLANNGGGVHDAQLAKIYSLVQYDLAWVVNNWRSDSCDLWEERHSSDFYWNTAGFVFSLNKAADFSDAMGMGEGSGWRTTASTIEATALQHDIGYIYEANERKKDSAVIHAIATFGVHDPTSTAAAETIRVLVQTFCEEYSIVENDVTAGRVGTLVGRYPGDVYDGGNPWQLLTAILAETFYKGAIANFDSVLERGVDPVLDTHEHAAWFELLQLPEGAKVSEMAWRQLTAGDSVMNNLYQKIRVDLPRVDEQIDRDTGTQRSAESLTWSYANVLHALHERGKASKKAEKMYEK